MADGVSVCAVFHVCWSIYQPYPPSCVLCMSRRQQTGPVGHDTRLRIAYTAAMCH